MRALAAKAASAAAEEASGMVLGSILRDLVSAKKAPQKEAAVDTRPIVLNVGGSSKLIPIPAHYDGWQHWLLDIDPKGKPDIVCDARELTKMPAGMVDAVYCSHNLEHYYRHDAIRVLAGFLHILKPEGFAEIRVPDIKHVMKHVVENNMDLEDTLYVASGNPILVRDVIYGWSRQIEASGQDFFAHKTGFSPQSLQAILAGAGFRPVWTFASNANFETGALAFKQEPTPAQRTLLRL